MSNSERLILQDFMETCLNRAGALVERPGYGLLEVVLPGDLALRFGDDHILLAFDYEVAGENPESTFVTYGSNLLDTATGLALDYGHYTDLYRPDIPAAPQRNLEKIVTASLEFQRCRPPRVVHRWMADQVFYEFNFRCVLRSYEKIESLLPVVVDGFSGLPSPGFRELWKNVVPCEKPEYTLPRAELLPLRDLYRRACREAELQVKRLAKPVQQKADVLKERELAKIRSYYEQTTREIQKKYEAAEDTDKKVRLSKQINATENDRRRREEDAAARYVVEAEVRLDHLVAYHLPCVHIKLEVQHKEKILNQIVVYNSYNNRIENPACPECGEPARRLVPGVAGRLICHRHY